MPDARYGANAPITFRMGGMQVEALYYGADLIWPAGHIISIPADEINWTDYAPLILSGVHVRVPADVLSWQDFAPEITIDGFVVPSDRLGWTDYAPLIASGASISAPADLMQWEDFDPVVGTSVIIGVPADVLMWADNAPSVSAGAHLKLPFDAMGWADFTPLLSGGASVSVPVDAWKWSEFAPNLGYAFSKAFSSAFNAIPHDYGVVVPVDEIGWADYVPEVEAASNVDFAYVETVVQENTIAIGAAHPARYVFIAIAANAGNNIALTLNSATIGGVAATIHSQANGAMSTGRCHIAIISALVPTGASALVAPVYNRSANIQYLSSYRVVGLASNSAIQEDGTYFTNTTGSWSRSLNVSAGGFAISAMFLINAGGNITSGNMTRDNREVNGAITHHAFSSLEPDTVPGRTFNWSNSNGSGLGVFAIATFR